MPTTAEEQYALELINRSRNDPSGEFDALIQGGVGVTADIQNALNFFNVDLALLQTQLDGYDSVAPLAFNDNLAQSAQTHTDLMVAFDEQSHNLPGEPGVGQRITDAGYTGWNTLSESIYAFTYDPLHAHAGFYIDWGNGPGGIQNPAGHREATLNGAFTEVGIAWVEQTDNSADVGPFLTTQHYGNRFAYESQLLGVVIDDTNNNDFYDVGEGMGGVTVTATGAAGTFVTTSWASGGYQMVVPDGIYTVVFSGGALNGVVQSTFTMNGENVKVDAEAADAVAGVVYFGTSAADTFSGSTMDDEIYGGAGDDHLTGDAGNDRLVVNGGTNQLFGGDGDDILKSKAGQTDFEGGAGHDHIIGSDDFDSVLGGTDNDTIVTLDGDDIIDAGEGNDYAYGGRGNDVVDGGAGDDNLRGNIGLDTLYGGEGADDIRGGGGDDTMFGSDGDDFMVGENHRDVLDGGAGNDVLIGDFGGGIADGWTDTFVFSSTANGGGGYDRVRGFADNEDVLDLTSFNFTDFDTQVKTLASNNASGLKINFGNGDVLLLEDFSNAQFDASDVILV